jgi:hypothetical protein
VSETRTMPGTTQAGQRDDFSERVDRCLAMVLHYAEVQEIAAIVKKVYAERSQEKAKCEKQ